MTPDPIVTLAGVSKTFTLHLRDGLTIGVVRDVAFSVLPGECVVLGGPSGAGKSSILKMIYGNYRCETGTILVRDGGETVDVARATPQRILALRRRVVSYVSQFLRVIPRISAIDIVAAAAREAGVGAGEAEARAGQLLTLLDVPERLWSLPPATFSGGEQQRVNIARGLAPDRPVLLLDEPTASLDRAKRAVVVELINQAKRARYGGHRRVPRRGCARARCRPRDRCVGFRRAEGGLSDECKGPMMEDNDSFVLANATLVLPDRVIGRGWLAVAEGRIADSGEGDPPETGFDMEGDTVVPGLIELHTDHLESHFAPRPQVRWHALSSVMAYDAQIAAAGITTVFDSLRAGSDADSTSLGADLWTLADAIEAATATGFLRAEHFTHLRCEIASPDVIEQAEGYAERYPIHIISLMDHTPGQRQFRDLATWRRFYVRRGHLKAPTPKRSFRSASIFTSRMRRGTGASLSPLRRERAACWRATTTPARITFSRR